MGKSHLKRLNAPNTWPVERKGTKWITKPRPGSQPLHKTISINTILKEMLKLFDTSKEIRLVLSKDYVRVDGIVKKSPNYPVSVMDVISIRDNHYRLLISKKGKLFLHKITNQDSLIKPNRIIGKKMLKGKKLQINFLDGKNLISNNNELKVNDTVVFENNKNKTHLKFEKGSLVYLTDGKQVGKIGVIKDIKEGIGSKPTKLIFMLDKKEHITLKDYAVVIGKDKPVINIPNE